MSGGHAHHHRLRHRGRRWSALALVLAVAMVSSLGVLAAHDALGADRRGSPVVPPATTGKSSARRDPSARRRPSGSGERQPSAVLARCGTAVDVTNPLSVAMAASLWPWCRTVAPPNLVATARRDEDRWAADESVSAAAAVTTAAYVDPRSSPVVVSVVVATAPGRQDVVVVTLFPMPGADTWGVADVVVTS